MAEWIKVEDRMPTCDADNCCMDEEDYGRYTDPLLVFDEDNADWFKAQFDSKKNLWTDCESGKELHGVTHWMEVTEPAV